MSLTKILLIGLLHIAIWLVVDSLIEPTVRNQLQNLAFVLVIAVTAIVVVMVSENSDGKKAHRLNKISSFRTK